MKPGHCIPCGPVDPVPSPCLLNCDLAHTCQDEAPCCCNAPCATFVIFWSSSPVCWQARPWQPSCPSPSPAASSACCCCSCCSPADRPLLLGRAGAACCCATWGAVRAGGGGPGGLARAPAPILRSHHALRRARHRAHPGRGRPPLSKDEQAMILWFALPLTLASLFRHPGPLPPPALARHQSGADPHRRHHRPAALARSASGSVPAGGSPPDRPAGTRRGGPGLPLYQQARQIRDKLTPILACTLTAVLISVCTTLGSAT